MERNVNHGTILLNTMVTKKSLEHLKKQLEQIEMYIIDDMSTF